MKIKFDKQIALGITLMVIMSPVILAGFLFRPIKLYFDAGMDCADEVGGMIVKHTDKWGKQ